MYGIRIEDQLWDAVNRQELGMRSDGTILLPPKCRLETTALHRILCDCGARLYSVEAAIVHYRARHSRNEEPLATIYPSIRSFREAKGTMTELCRPWWRFWG